MLQRLSGDVAERGIRTLDGLLTHTPLVGAHPPTDDDYANTELDYGNETQGKLNEKNTIFCHLIFHYLETIAPILLLLTAISKTLWVDKPFHPSVSNGVSNSIDLKKLL